MKSLADPLLLQNPRALHLLSMKKITMVKGHNKNGKMEPEKKTKDQEGHEKSKKRELASKERKGRHKEDDQSGGTKGQNAIS